MFQASEEKRAKMRKKLELLPTPIVYQTIYLKPANESEIKVHIYIYYEQVPKLFHIEIKLFSLSI